MEKPDVDHIEGLSPAISIEQKSTSHNPRSTVGTITEIYDYLRLLYARAGEPRCPEHGCALSAQTVSQMVDQVLAQPAGARLMLLAPMVEARKGEHRETIEQLRAQGYARLRVDGTVREIDELEPLDRRKKHTLAVVVDRFKVHPDRALRLAESFEAALQLADGRARVAWMDEPQRPDLLFSAHFACPICGYSLPELEPRIFSFNNPAGACPQCDGLGTETFFDPQRIVAHPELSLPGGAIPGWDRRNAYYYQVVEALASHYGFAIDTPFADLPAAIRQIILYGSGKDAIRFTYGSGTSRTHPFEGIIPNMERRYRESESSIVREELARFVGTKPCSSCEGTRLNRYARHVFVQGKALPQIVALPVGQAQRFLPR